ncbi:hypothetical protein AKJ39_00795 [candidate division MSBL1 archaeon SCGC-AAA259J03]|uniref:TNase-like domain-containing protein n=3 Tax=candidate division MSBL1 TaxID=215777 RepID=A0A133UPQ2_9EURY|nr:hypothetical protein AKJ61_00915 [candidate division MSBL1 archaeon SCGC-AAA259B11]KXA96106.1 hypothetical protein AKJ38_03910 [candidate division MSBL1 archaeon SCGC-AAA259I14]KXA98762.1 hypothetical protein AKJ39_00795 [candidate division MSBL1 archaeon SCGC-AAA259J03]
MENREIIVIVLVLLVVGALVYFIYFRDTSDNSNYPNYEAIGISKRIIDGDTFVVKIRKVLDPHKGVKSGMEKLRLAGVDTDELKQSEAAGKREKVENMSQAKYEETYFYKRALEAKKLLETFVPSGTKVYLDIDDLAFGRDSYRGYYGRLIVVAYVKREDKWINVNAKLINEEYSKMAESEYPISNKFCSEFNPYTWIDEGYIYK